MEQVKLSRVGKYVMKKPAMFTVTHYPEENLWSAVNNDMRLRGYGNTREAAIENVEEDIDDVISMYLKHVIWVTPESEDEWKLLDTHFGIWDLIEQAKEAAK